VAICGLLGARLLARADDTVSVWAVRGDKLAGQHLGPADVVPVRLRFAAQSQADRYLSAEDPFPADQVLQRPVTAGELLPRNALGAVGTRVVELPLSVPVGGVPATVHVGSVVDVWVTRKDGGRARLVLDDVPVIALASPGSDLAPSAERQVIVGVSDRATLPAAVAAAGSSSGSAGSVVITREAG
jgi:hypothetical protein